MGELQTRPFWVHECDGVPWCECMNGMVVFVADEAAARAMCKHYLECPAEYAAVVQDERLGALRPFWAGKPMRGPRHNVAEEERLWRRAGWGDPYDWRCFECGLSPWDSVPESQPSNPNDPEFCLECDPRPELPDLTPALWHVLAQLANHHENCLQFGFSRMACRKLAELGMVDVYQRRWLPYARVTKRGREVLAARAEQAHRDGVTS